MSEAPKPIGIEAQPNVINADFEEVRTDTVSGRGLDEKRRATLRAVVRKALQNVRPVVERGRTSISDEDAYIIAQARTVGGESGITRREQYLHEYARGKRMPALGEMRRAYNKVEGVLKNKKREHEEMIPEAIRALDEALNKQGAKKLEDEGMLNNLDALVDAGTVSIKDADVFLVLHALSPEERLKRTRKEQKTYDRVLKEVQDDQAGFEKALDKLVKKKGYTAEEREVIKQAAEGGTRGLSEALVREYVRSRYNDNIKTSDGTSSIGDVIKTIVQDTRRANLRAQGLETLSADEAEALANAALDPNNSFSVDAAEGFLRTRGGERGYTSVRGFFPNERGRAVTEAEKILTQENARAEFERESAEWPQLLSDFGWSNEKVDEFRRVLRGFSQGIRKGLTEDGALASLQMEDRHIFTSGRALARFQEKQTA